MIDLTPPEIRDHLTKYAPKAFKLTEAQLDLCLTVKKYLPYLGGFNCYIIYSLWVQYSQEVFGLNESEVSLTSLGGFVHYLGAE